MVAAMEVSHLPYAYFEGRIIPVEQAKVSIATHALQYGTGVFGGIRGYLDQDGSTINIFRLRDHMTRFTQSSGLIKIGLPLNIDGLCDLAVELTRRNAPTSNVYFRPYAYKAGLDLGPTLEAIEDGFALYMLPLGSYYSAGNGLSVMVSSWNRIQDNAIPARGKVSGSYINSAITKDEAVKYGFDEAILLNARGKVSEGSACNLMVVRRGVLVTPPVTADILEGITRRSILQMARDAGIPVEEREIDRSELYVAEELFFCGTGVQVTSVTQVDRRPVGTGVPGPITTQLQTKFFDTVHGRDPQYREWLTPVAVPVPVAAD
jgi:branched-chain amino acid aminotransferase